MGRGMRSLSNSLWLVLSLLQTTSVLANDLPENAHVVWASTREDGRHEIYRMRADGTEVVRLTDDGGKFPDWSPDGNWISYVKEDYSTHLMRWDGTEDKKISSGSCKFWMLDGSGLVCYSQGQYSLVDPGTGFSKPLFNKSEFTKTTGARVDAGGITHDGRWLLAITDLYRDGFTGDNGSFKARYAAVALDLQHKERVYLLGGGCGPTPAPAGELVYHVCGGGMGECIDAPDIFRLDINDLSNRTSYQPEVAHPDEDWGHQYNPRISNDNKWVVYAASTGCHDHETCDYEIFIHELGSAFTSRTRLTNYMGNDQWPALHIGDRPEPAGCALSPGGSGGTFFSGPILLCCLLLCRARRRR